MAEVEYVEMEISTMLGDGSAEMIERAIDLCQFFDEEMPEEEQERVKTRDKLVTNLVELAKATGSQDILATTIDLAKELYELDATAGDNMLRSYRANNYAVALAHRYWLTGQPGDLHESTRLSEDAVYASSQAESILRMSRGTILRDPGLEVHTLNTLAARLDERFQLTGSLHNLNRSIEIMELLVAAIPWEEWKPVRAEWLLNLAASLQRRYEQDESDSRRDLHRAVELSEEALESVGENISMLQKAKCTLANALGGRARGMEQMADLDQAIRLFREAREATSEEDPDCIEIRVNLAMRLFQKSDITDVALESRSCSAEAIEVAASTLDSLPDDHPARAHLHNLLGLCYYARYSHSYSPLAAQEAAKQAVEHLEEALRSPHYPSLFRHVQAGRMMLHLYCSMAKWKKAYETAVIAVEMIPKLSSRSIRNSDKQRMLSAHDVVGFGADAAAAALNAGLDGYTSLRLLEMGRGSIAASVAEMRPDLVALRRDHPALAETFHSLRDHLQAQSPRQHRDSESFDALLREIRNEPGFERFLEPPSEQEVRDAAQDGPIIMLNASQFRDADAILIKSHQIRVLSLRGVTLNSLHDWSSDLKSPELLKWLWDFIARPVLDALQIHLPLQKDSTSTRLPRIWWIPTGILSRFPLHAAGVYSAGFADSVMDRAVSSYSSSIKALNAGRRASCVPHPAESKSLLVEMPRTPGCSYLTYVTEEIQTLQARLMSKGFNNMVLASKAAQKKDVLKALESCHIFHFAGHGTENVSDPLRSALLLNDWETDPMTVDSVLNVDLSESNPFLAYLAACETGQVTASRFYDESIHLIGAYQLAGFRHVIGTLWSVDDHGSVLMATGTYEGLLENMADDSVSRSLHNAARRLRDDSRRSREGEEGTDVRNAIIISEAESTDTRWIPFVHFGL
ncbi:CHAT domain-containing protein [Ilyonectria robusta]|uniref:CHAT domain-containing protein n=1 Tax=Ilyonectria robusta TaxID=1079257 RepID=UPI001E8CAEB9|nr:CHAT domain-containing protein [Ilyonectria robusta]KAH8729930.1 CHAT domain-containing protein [Ilyonectria robusta]